MINYILTLLGKAIHGIVQLALHKPSGENVVIKSVVSSVIDTPADDLSENSRTEIVLAKMMNHIPFFLTTFGAYQECGTTHIVSCFCSGGDMFSSAGQLPHNKVRRYFTELLQGIATLHSFGYAHRDISLENLLLHSDGSIRVCDFGQVVQARDPPTNPNIVKSSIGMCGKDYYRPPEVYPTTTSHSGQVIPSRYDPQSVDVFSCGVVLFMLLAGCPPWERAKPSDARYVHLMKHGSWSLLKLWHKEGMADRSVTQLIDRMLAFDPKARPSSASCLHHPWLASPENKAATEFPETPRFNSRGDWIPEMSPLPADVFPPKACWEVDAAASPICVSPSCAFQVPVLTSKSSMVHDPHSHYLSTGVSTLSTSGGGGGNLSQGSPLNLSLGGISISGQQSTPFNMNNSATGSDITTAQQQQQQQQNVKSTSPNNLKNTMNGLNNSSMLISQGPIGTGGRPPSIVTSSHTAHTHNNNNYNNINNSVSNASVNTLGGGFQQRRVSLQVPHDVASLYQQAKNSVSNNQIHQVHSNSFHSMPPVQQQQLQQQQQQVQQQQGKSLLSSPPGVLPILQQQQQQQQCLLHHQNQQQNQQYYQLNNQGTIMNKDASPSNINTSLSSIPSPTINTQQQQQQSGKILGCLPRKQQQNNPGNSSSTTPSATISAAAYNIQNSS